MFDNDWRVELLKAAAMLVIVASEWWMMQPYHEPLIPRLWLTLARFFQNWARRFGLLGMTFEYKYYEAI